MPAKDAHAVRIFTLLTVIASTLSLYWPNQAPAAAPKNTPPVDLTPNIVAGDLQQVKLLFELDGKLTLKAESAGPITTPVKVKAQLVYDEKTLAAAAPPKTTWPASAVRYYETAQATITFAEGTVQPTLRSDRRIVAVSSASADDVVLYSPLGPLDRDELDLINTPANSTLLDGLLPRRTVSVGETWKVSPELLTALLGLDRVNSQSVTCKLERVERNAAVVHATGPVSGASGGVSSEMTVAAKFTFDLTRKRINWFAMSIKEKRAVGHAQPGIEATARIQMSLAARTTVPTLHADVLGDLNLTADTASRLLEFRSPSGGFELLLDRTWHVMIERQDVSILRLVDRGDLLAQCNISALPPIDEGEQFTIIDFQEDVKRALDANFGEFVAASESLTDGGLHVMRVVATGTISDLAIEWAYYHLSDDQGRRASSVFTYESELADRFAAADQAVTSSFRFVDPPPTKDAESK